MPPLPTALRLALPGSPPRVLNEALALFVTREPPGAASNPAILGWAREVGVAGAYVNDGIAWCGLLTAVVVKHAGFEPVKNPLRARNWGSWGQKANKPSLGDILVFERALGGSHVGIYVGEDAGVRLRNVDRALAVHAANVATTAAAKAKAETTRKG